MTGKKTSGCLKWLIILILIILAVILIFFIFRKPILNGAASFLVLREPLEKSGCIVVLAGERGERVVEGVRLFKEGWAPKMLMSGGLGEAGIPLSSLMKQQAVKLGVPPGVIFEEDRSQDTGEDAIFSLEIMKGHGIKDFILVTSPYHSRRASIIFKKLAKESGMDVISFPVRDSWFKIEDCWHHKRGIKAVYSEYSKLIWYLFFPHSMDLERKNIGPSHLETRN
ncbi:MAG: YdcF family protein [Chloroflexi bacterium]|nr:YdcF family protein [Chloroflexota bacterium]